MLLSVNAVPGKVAGICKRFIIIGAWGLARYRRGMPFGSREYCQRVVGPKVGGA